MSFRLVPKSVTLNDLERLYFTEFGKPALQKTIFGGIYARVYCILVRVQCRRKESSQYKYKYKYKSQFVTRHTSQGESENSWPRLIYGSPRSLKGDVKQHIFS